ncbi:MAG: T9SS type A sorting domain-containing protein [Bacteroidetes bacterium]|nr:T9SS type A sorting domain-containing protein [Bacteroidota bacterium]
MELNKQLNKRLATYSAVAGTLVAATVANANIIYTDVNPDALLTLAGVNVYEIDLNNDAISDFEFYIGTTIYSYAGSTYPITYIAAWGIKINTGTTSTYTFMANPMNRLGGVNGAAPATYGKPFAIPASNLINSTYAFPSAGSTSWVGSFATTWAWPVGPKFWANGGGTANEYFGAKFEIAGQTHYGWINASVTNAMPATITIHGYAYENVAGVGITTGDMAVGLKGGKTSRVDIYSFGRTINVNASNASKVEVFDMVGKRVYTGSLNRATNKIDMSGHNGMHIVKVGTTTKKVYIN